MHNMHNYSMQWDEVSYNNIVQFYLIIAYNNVISYRTIYRLYIVRFVGIIYR